MFPERKKHRQTPILIFAAGRQAFYLTAVILPSGNEPGQRCVVSRNRSGALLLRDLRQTDGPDEGEAGDGWNAKATASILREAEQHAMGGPLGDPPQETKKAE